MLDEYSFSSRIDRYSISLRITHKEVYPILHVNSRRLSELLIMVLSSMQGNQYTSSRRTIRSVKYRWMRQESIQLRISLIEMAMEQQRLWRHSIRIRRRALSIIVQKSRSSSSSSRQNEQHGMIYVSSTTISMINSWWIRISLSLDEIGIRIRNMYVQLSSRRSQQMRKDIRMMMLL